MRVWPLRLRISRKAVGDRQAWHVERWKPNGATGEATAYRLRTAWSSFERHFDPVGREVFGPILVAFTHIVDGIDAGIRALRPKSLHRELTYWAIAAVVVLILVTR